MVPATVTCRSSIASSSAACTLAGARRVDLVGEDQVVEDRAWLEAELAGAAGLMVDLRAGYVRREEIGGELDARKPGVEVPRQALDRSGLRQARQPFHEQVAVGQEADHEPLDDVFLADDGLAHPSLQVSNRVVSAHATSEEEYARAPPMARPGTLSVWRRQSVLRRRGPTSWSILLAATRARDPG